MGFGQIAELANDWDGYTGRLPATTAPVAKVLGYYGYKTAAFGKWHNTPAEETTQQGPFDRWPTGRLFGFDYFYGFLAGESSQWEPAVVENTVRLPAPHREGYHFTEDMADKAVTWIRQHQALAPETPFFMYWAPGAAHGPHHIFKEWADKYKGKFDDGWDAMRTRIFARQKQLGWIPANTQLTPRPATLAAWQDIPEDEKPFQRRLMEVFAGMTEHADAQAGRLIDELERLGIRDNTLIFYVLSDNGSSAEGQNGTISELLAQNGIPSEVKDHIRALNELGGLDVLGTQQDRQHVPRRLGLGGQHALPGDQARRLALRRHAHADGGVLAEGHQAGRGDAHAVPPRQRHRADDLRRASGSQPPKRVDGVPQEPMDGVSMKYTFADAKAPGRKKSQYFEVMGSRAIYQDGWIASVFGPALPGSRACRRASPPGRRTRTRGSCTTCARTSRRPSISPARTRRRSRR